MGKILLIGAQGQVGQVLHQVLSPLAEVVAVGRSDLDLLESDKIRQVIAATRPEVVINAAAYTAVDKAEAEVEMAYAINGTAPKVIAEAVQELGATLIHLSTDYVFKGDNSVPYLEQDLPGPLGIYGKSKLAGELEVQQGCDRNIILRTAWVYGVYGKGNFVKTMLRLSNERPEVRVVADQVGTPTWAQHIAEAVAHLVQASENTSDDFYGVYHFTNSGVCSWYDFAIAIFEEAHQLALITQKPNVIPITTAEYPTTAQRPSYSVLNNSKIRPLLNDHPPHWRAALRKMLKNLKAQS
ncbi:dTDP-4-dehydrorhamnose reductase [Acaryochloris thomasi RCC1774]|uniref:dTDP-4-dehydrorhamnose reductase n=1 Tax=Acaryochloris thomasi RCC1774 TaxID=1764569 RepID=A0A2W1JEM2_9CYAN|nr:dTDP-4-dehydrorhamnose reductase [Acaryochloris thomasi]PZD72220.1 dTDP-4-dehydrorhamnose reductase [Acaryochloris thomasi RCC1774]